MYISLPCYLQELRPSAIDAGDDCVTKTILNFTRRVNTVNLQCLLSFVQ